MRWLERQKSVKTCNFLSLFLIFTLFLSSYVRKIEAQDQLHSKHLTNSSIVSTLKERFASVSLQESNCVEPEDSGDDFPEGIFTDEQLRNGAFVLHLIAAVYFFTLLAVVCNDYFLPAVECICDDLGIPKDVAAATFMSTATTMPEFFTNTISTLITNSDMGVGTIIGSLMFNTLGVAAVSGIAIVKSVQLDWWPVTRDCIFYSFNTLALISIAWGGIITFYETLAMMILLIAYYVVIFNQNRIMHFVRILIEDNFNCCLPNRYDLTVPIEKSSKATLPIQKDPEHDGIFTVSQNDLSSTVNLTVPKKAVDDEESDDAVKKRKSLFRVPEGSLSRKIWWAYTWPIKAFLTCVCPSPKTHRRLYPVTFIMCIALIGGNSYMIVWMLTVVGHIWKIPDVIMGMTFLAAGSAMPESLSSLISVRKGEGGIGVSNALGANSLAILLSLNVPWVIKNCLNFNNPEKNFIRINSQGIEYAIGILLLSTLSLYIIMVACGFRLRRTVGVALFIVYFVYIVLQIFLQSNVFFDKKETC